MRTFTKAQAQARCSECDLNVHQIDTIISNWDGEIEITFKGADESEMVKVNDLFDAVMYAFTKGDFGDDTLNNVLVQNLVIPINVRRLQAENKQRLANNEHTVTVVAGCYSYTIGASKTKCLGKEFICFIGSQIGGLVLNEVVELFSNGKIVPGEIFVLDSIRPKNGISGARAKIMTPEEGFEKVTQVFHYPLHIKEGLVDENSDVLLVMVSDKHNVLPDEDGYDSTWDQSAKWYDDVKQ